MTEKISGKQKVAMGVAAAVTLLAGPVAVAGASSEFPGAGHQDIGQVPDSGLGYRDKPSTDVLTVASMDMQNRTAIQQSVIHIGEDQRVGLMGISESQSRRFKPGTKSRHPILGAHVADGEGVLRPINLPDFKVAGDYTKDTITGMWENGREKPQRIANSAGKKPEGHGEVRVQAGDVLSNTITMAKSVVAGLPIGSLERSILERAIQKARNVNGMDGGSSEEVAGLLRGVVAGLGGGDQGNELFEGKLISLEPKASRENHVGSGLENDKPEMLPVSPSGQDPEGLLPENDESDPEDSEPGRTAGLSSPPEGGIEGVDYTKQTVDAGDIQPGMKLVAGGGIPARDEQIDGFPFLKDEAGNLIILEEGEELEVLEAGDGFITVRRVDNFTNLPKEERVVALWIGPEGTTTDKKDDQGNPTGHQLWKRQALDGEVPVKDVIEPEVSGEQAKISIDIERLNQIIAKPKEIIGKQPLYEDSGMQHNVSSADGRTEAKISPSRKAKVEYDGEIRVLVEILVDGQIYVKKVDGKELIAWMPLRGLADSELSGLSADELKALGFEVEDISLDLKPFVEEQFLVPLTESEKGQIARRSSLNGVIPNKVNAFMVGDKLMDSFWMKGVVNKGYNYGEGNRAEVKGLASLVDEAYKDPKENSPDFILSLNAKNYGDNHTVKVVNGSEKTIEVRINGHDFSMFRLLRNPSNNDPIRVENVDWTLGDFFGADVSFYLTDEDWVRIMEFLANPSAKKFKFRAESGLVNTH